MTTTHASHLFGKYLDPLIAIGLGTISYYIYERRHRATQGYQTLLLTRQSNKKGISTNEKSSQSKLN